MQEMINMFEKSSEQAMASARRIAEINAQTVDKLFQQQTSLAAFYLDIGTRGLELMTKAKGYQDLLAGQTALLRECNERGMDALRQGYTLANETGAVYGEFAEATLKQASEQAAQAGKQAAA
jgi:hypothetical protein